MGVTGTKGVTGAKGATGARGPTGARWPTGVKGATGARGATEVKGATGAKGTTGATGPASQVVGGGTAAGGTFGANAFMGMFVSGSNASEALVQQPMPIAGTLKNFTIPAGCSPRGRHVDRLHRAQERCRDHAYVHDHDRERSPHLLGRDPYGRLRRGRPDLDRDYATGAVGALGTRWTAQYQ